MKFNLLKVNNTLVHQACEEDVLICNGYIGLPSSINKALFDETLHDKLNGNEQEAFDLLYKSGLFTVDAEEFHQKNYLLKSIYSEIPKNILHNCSDEINKVLNANYVVIDDKYVINTDSIDENSEKILLKFMKRPDLIVRDSERAVLCNFFRINNFILGKKIYYATMFNDANHPHYYKKEHEHVPGMMIIEAVRQAFYAYVYTFNKCKRGDVSISITKLDSNFYRYIQSNYPLKIMVEDMSSANDDRDLKLKAKLFQRNILVAEVFYCGTIINLNTFKRMRQMGLDEKEYIFHPIKDTYTSLILINENAPITYIAKVNEISMTGMRLSFPGDTILETGQKFNFILDIKNNNKVISSCQIDSHFESSGGVEAVVKFVNLSKKNAMEMSDYIKNYTHINDRELII
jgi:hypothetical protein